MSSYQQELIRYLAQHNIKPHNIVKPQTWNFLYCLRNHSNEIKIQDQNQYLITISVEIIKLFVWWKFLILFGGHWDSLWVVYECRDNSIQRNFWIETVWNEFSIHWCIQNRGYVKNVIYWSEWMTLNIHIVRESFTYYKYKYYK